MRYNCLVGIAAALVGAAQGAVDYIRKPIDPPRFLARVRAALRRHGGEATSP